MQNADDAGAREVRLCLDLRHHGGQGLPSPSLAQFQGPSLLVYNDGVFTDTDFRCHKEGVNGIVLPFIYCK